MSRHSHSLVKYTQYDDTDVTAMQLETKPSTLTTVVPGSDFIQTQCAQPKQLLQTGITVHAALGWLIQASAEAQRSGHVQCVLAGICAYNSVQNSHSN